MSSEQEQTPVGPSGPVLRVPINWWLAVTHTSDNHRKRTYAMLLQIAAIISTGGHVWLYGLPLDLYGLDAAYDVDSHVDTAMNQLEYEGYIIVSESQIKLTKKTRTLFGLENAE